jgi:hypothetical protein
VPLWAEEGFKLKFTAILSANIEGYTHVMSADEYASIRILVT